MPGILLAIWHNVPCNDFNIFLNWSDAREQGEAMKMTCTSSAFPILWLQSKIEFFKGKFACPGPGKMQSKHQSKELNGECLSPVNRGMPDVDDNLTLSKSTFED